MNANKLSMLIECPESRQHHDRAEERDRNSDGDPERKLEAKEQREDEEHECESPAHRSLRVSRGAL